MIVEHIQILIDGGNFHHLALKKLGIQELEFDFEGFIKFLANGRVITENGKRFYVGSVREREGDIRSKQAMSHQTSLFTTPRLNGWEIRTSKLRTRTERIVIDDRVRNHEELLKKGVKEVEFERTREKGIDVKLATDLIVGAVDNRYDTAIIVSSDGDLVPAVDWVRLRQNKKVEYIGFSITGKDKDDTRPSQTLITHTDIQRILVASDLKPFIKEKLVKHY